MVSSSRLSERWFGFWRLHPIRQDPTDLRHVVLDAKLLLDDLSDSLSSPDLAPKSEVLRTFLKEFGEPFGTLLPQRVLVDGPALAMS
jgi:hypothetical protein